MNPPLDLDSVRRTLLALHADFTHSPDIRQSLRPRPEGVTLRGGVGLPTDSYGPPASETPTVPPDAEAQTVPPSPAPPSGTAPTGAGLALLHRLGQGGMGEVWAARQLSLDRVVAVKRIRTEGDPSPEQVDAFIVEAVVTADLEHPNIVPIHAREVDEQGRPLIVMKLVQGVTWRDLLHPTKAADPKRREELQRRAAGMVRDDHIDILLRVADAMRFAHSRGVLHRDLKPENIMVGAFGEVIVMDWGLALDVRDQPDSPGKALPRATVAGPAGTPCYMAPEQANAPNSVLDERTDQYLLGAILYEILTGTPPHLGPTVIDVVMTAAGGDVSPPAERAPNRPIPEALARVAMTALARDPAERFADVAGFQAALREFLGGESKRREARTHFDRARELLDGPAPAGGSAQEYARFSEAVGLLQRAVGLWPEDADTAAALLQAQERFVARAIQGGDLNLAAAQLAALQAQGAEGQKVADPLGRQLRAAAEARRRQKRRFRLAVGSTAALLAVVAALAPFAWVQWRAAEDNLSKANEQTDIAQAKKKEADDNRTTAETQRDLAQRAAYVADLRLGWKEWGDNNFPRVVELLNEAEPSLRGWDWGHLYALRHAELRSTPGHRGGTTTLAFRPDGRCLATGGLDRCLRFWDAATGKELAVREGFSDALKQVVFSSDGTRLAVLAEAPALIEGFAVAGSTPVVTLWDAAAIVAGNAPAGPLLTLKGQLAPTFSSDGALLATLGPSGIYLHAAADGTDKGTLPARARRSERLSWSKDGRHLAVLTSDGKAEIWDLSEKKLAFKAGTPGSVSQAEFSADGTVLATVESQRIGADTIWSIHRWRLPDGKEVGKVEKFPGFLKRIAFSPDGRLLAATVESEVRLMDAANGKLLRTLTGPFPHPATELAFSADGRRLIAVDRYDEHGLVPIWDTGTGEMLRVLRGHIGRTAIALASDGVLAASGDDSGAVKLWDAGADPVTRTFASQSPIGGLAFAPDGRLAVMGFSQGAETTLRAADAGAELRRVPAAVVAFNPSGGQMAVADRFHDAYAVQLWDAEGTHMIRELEGPKEWVRALAFSPDGRLVASAGGNSEDKAGEVFVWNAATGERVASFDDCESAVLAIAFDPRSRLLAAGAGRLQRNRAGEIKVWDLERREAVGGFPRQPARINAVAFDRDGRLATAASDGIVRIWDPIAGKELLRLVGHRSAVLSVAFSSDGKRLATGGDDKTLRLWESAEGKELFVLDEPEVVSAVAFSPDGRWLASAGGTVFRFGKKYVTLRKAVFPGTTGS